MNTSENFHRDIQIVEAYMNTTTWAAVAAFFAILFLSIHSIGQLGAPGEKHGKGTVVIRAARVIDGTGGAVINNGAVMVNDNKVSIVGPFAAMSFPAGTRVIDLGDATI